MTDPQRVDVERLREVLNDIHSGLGLNAWIKATEKIVEAMPALLQQVAFLREVVDSGRQQQAELLARAEAAERAREEAERKVAELMAQRDELVACTCGCSRKSCPECGCEIIGPLSWPDPKDPAAAAFLVANGSPQ